MRLQIVCRKRRRKSKSVTSSTRVASFLLWGSFLTPDTRFLSFTGSSFAYLYATLCFFGGVLLTYLFEVGLHTFEKWLLKKKEKKADEGTVEDPEGGAWD